MTREEALTRARRTREACGHCNPGPCDQCAADAILKAVEDATAPRPVEAAPCSMCGGPSHVIFAGYKGDCCPTCGRLYPDRPQATGAPTSKAETERGGGSPDALAGADPSGLTAEVVQAMLEPMWISEWTEEARDRVSTLARSWLAMRAAATKAATALAGIPKPKHGNNARVHRPQREAVAEALALLAAQGVKPE